MRSLRELLDDGLDHHRAGRLADAGACYREALAAAPDDPEANHLAGVLAFQSGHIEDAARHFARAAENDGSVAKYHGNFGAALLALRRYGEALPPLERAVALAPGDPTSLSNLATVLRETDRLEEAIAVARRATEAAPADAPSWTVLASALFRAGRHDEALAAAERAIACEPANVEALNLKGSLLHSAGRVADAVDVFEQAISLAPDYAEARCNLGLALLDAYRYDDAAMQYQLAIESRPDDTTGYGGLARALRLQGRIEDAMPLLRRAVELAPDDPRPAGNLLFNLLGSADTDGRRLLDEHRRWADRFAAPIAAAAGNPRHANDPDPARQLRVGYVSPDFSVHPVGRLLLPVLRAHDRAAVEPFCYAASRRQDRVTAALRAASAGWRDVAGLGDAALVEAVRADRIDILVDLAGHTAGNRLLAFARRPAPVQASWLGYPSTTGLEAIDWLITDSIHAPPGAEAEAVERLMRLPHGLLCFGAPDEAPPVGPSPCGATGPVTFGSFNNPAKLSASVLALWSRVLAEVPESQLLLRYHVLEDPAACAHLRDRMAAAGIDPARIAFAGRADYREVLGAYGGVDIALDTMPYSGTMTTLEALWMGVPVVTLAGDRMAARQSAAHLTAAGLGELVASDRDGYLAIAAALAGDRDRLSALRAGMRARLQASPLCDAAGFAHDLESAFRGMWRDWCGRHAGSAG
jgi:predicted O-linked N-acetylglucosamine transferase (SPINDLY family)